MVALPTQKIGVGRILGKQEWKAEMGWERKVGMGTTNKKCLMKDIMSIYQLGFVVQCFFVTLLDPSALFH